MPPPILQQPCEVGWGERDWAKVTPQTSLLSEGLPWLNLPGPNLTPQTPSTPYWTMTSSLFQKCNGLCMLIRKMKQNSPAEIFNWLLRLRFKRFFHFISNSIWLQQTDNGFYIQKLCWIKDGKMWPFYLKVEMFWGSGKIKQGIIYLKMLEGNGGADLFSLQSHEVI